MNPRMSLTLDTYGVLVELQIATVTETAADCVLLLKSKLSNVAFDISSVPFFLTKRDFEKWAIFIENRIASAGCADPFVTYGLGFQFTILDADDFESSIVVLLNVGMAEDNRIYCGSEIRVLTEKLATFAHGLQAISEFVPESD